MTNYFVPRRSKHMVDLHTVLPSLHYFGPDRLGLLQRAYDEAWSHCTAEFQDANKREAAQAYVARAVLHALETSPHDFERAAWAGRIAASKLNVQRSSDA